MHIYFIPLSYLLTKLLKARKESLEEVFAGVRHGKRAKLRHYDPVPLAVLFEGIALQEPTHVRHLTSLNLELVQHGHPIKPMVVAVMKHRC